MAENEEEVPNNNEQNDSTVDLKQVREDPGIIENDQKKFNEEMLVNQQKLLEKIAIQDKILEMLDTIQNELREVKENQKVIEPVKKIIHAPEIPQKNQQTTGTVKSCKFVIRNVFKDVSKMKKYTAYYNDNEEYFGVPWHLNICYKENNLGTYLECGKSEDIGKWSIDTEYDLKVFHPNGKSVSRSFKYTFTRCNGYGNAVMIKWEDLKKDYLVDDKLIVEAHVTINKMIGIYKENLRSFDKSNEEFSDVVLKVKDEKFYVSKLFLANHSTYFKALFLGNFNESEKGEVVLPGIDPYDFQKYMEVLYGENAINEATVEGILLIADMYDTPIAIRKCEEFMVEKSAKTLKKKLQMSIRYNLENLKKKCLSDIKTADDIRSVIPNDLSDLDPSISNILLEKALSFK